MINDAEPATLDRGHPSNHDRNRAGPNRAGTSRSGVKRQRHGSRGVWIQKSFGLSSVRGFVKKFAEGSVYAIFSETSHTLSLLIWSYHTAHKVIHISKGRVLSYGINIIPLLRHSFTTFFL